MADVISRTIVIVGDDGSGKTSLVKALCEGKRPPAPVVAAAKEETKAASTEEPVTPTPGSETPEKKALTINEAANAAHVEETEAAKVEASGEGKEETKPEETKSSEEAAADSKANDEVFEKSDSKEIEDEKSKSDSAAEKCDAVIETKEENGKDDDKEVAKEEETNLIEELKSKLVYSTIKVDDKEFELAFLEASKDLNDKLGQIYSKINVILLCYGVDSPDSLANLELKWKNEIKSHTKPKETVVILVGNKTDLRNNTEVIDKLKKVKKTTVSTKQGKQVSKKIGANGFFECSSETGENVLELFQAIARLTLAPGADSKKQKRKSKGKCTIS